MGYTLKVIEPYQGIKNPNICLDQSVHGVVGTCVGEKILIEVNPWVGGWEKYLPWILAHEHNHNVWGYNYYYLQGNKFQDLPSSIISEGLADSFAKDLCPDLTPSWNIIFIFRWNMRHTCHIELICMPFIKF